MNSETTTGIYPIGIPSPEGGICHHGWFFVETEAPDDGTAPPVLALPLALEDGDYTLTIEVQCSQITLTRGSATLAAIDCTGHEADVLAILQGGRIGLATVPADLAPDSQTRLSVDHMAVVDMQPFFDDHQHRLAVMEEHDPALHAQQRRLFDGMPAYRRARKLAENRPTPVAISPERKAAIWDDIMQKRDPLAVRASSSDNPLKTAILKGRSRSSDSGEGV